MTEHDFRIASLIKKPPQLIWDVTHLVKYDKSTVIFILGNYFILLQWTKSLIKVQFCLLGSCSNIFSSFEHFVAIVSPQ